MTSTVGNEKIEIQGVQKTNISKISDPDKKDVFEDGVIGGSFTQEFNEAMDFQEAFQLTGEDGK